MSKYLRPSLYNGRGIENQLLNLMYNSHDLCCGCPNPRKHLISLLNREKCLPSEEISTKENTSTEENPDGFDEGDLEKIFALPEEDAAG